jgi:transcriptional regulator with XRE-family HTH domain
MTLGTHYSRPTVMLLVGGVVRNVSAADLVLLTFGGPRPDGAVARPRDGDPGNLRPENLYWGVRRPGRHRKINRGGVATIHDKYAQGASIDELALEFGVSAMTIWSILKGDGYQDWQPKERAVLRSRKGARKLTREAVASILDKYVMGASIDELALEFGVSTSTVSSILRGESYPDWQPAAKYRAPLVNGRLRRPPRPPPRAPCLYSIDEAQEREIQARAREGRTEAELAAEFKMTRSQVYRVLSGKHRRPDTT